LNPKRQKLIDQIQKLLALSMSTTEHEATVAATIAQELITRHAVAALAVLSTREREEKVVASWMKDQQIVLENASAMTRDATPETRSLSRLRSTDRSAAH
jgi:uncharacterized protein YoaH (UPF0181 family)